MSRFEEVVNEAISEVVLGEACSRPRRWPSTSRSSCATRQGARRAEVTVQARFPEHKPAPVSGIQTQEIYTLHGAAVGTELGTRRLIGVTAQGITACPCAQELVAAVGPRAASRSDGFGAEEIERILDAVPVATHNQRGLGTLHVGCTELCDDEIDAGTLLRIVEGSMSSEIYELMKRADEAHVVEKAHRRPRFVEDCVREMVRGVLESFPHPGCACVRLRAPAQPRDDPSAQRRRRALRHAGRDPRRARLGPAGRDHTSRRAWLDELP